jgi:hypothetical protein
MTLDALNVVLELSRSESRTVRANACVALAQFDADRARARLFELSDPARERDADVRCRAIEGLARLGGQAVTARLVQLSDARLEPSLDVRLQVVAALSRLDDGAAMSRLVELADARRERDKAIRRAAVSALADRQPTTTDPDARLALLRVSSQDPDPEVRQEALRHLESEGQGAGVASADVGPEEYDLLGQLRRSGVAVDLGAVRWSRRLALAWQDGKSGLRFGGRQGDPSVAVRVRVVALGASAFALFAVFVGLGLLTGQVLGAKDSLALLGVAGTLGAAVALAPPWLARPSARLPDRLLAAVFESLAVLLRSLPIWAASALVVLSMRAMMPGWLATSTPWVLGLVVVGPIVSAVIRLVTTLAYGLSQQERRRWVAQVTLGTLAGAGALGIAIGLGSLVLPGTFAVTDGVKWFLVGLPCCVALAVGFTGVDAQPDDRAAVDGRWLRAVTAGVLCVPAVLGVALLLEGRESARRGLRLEQQLAADASSAADPQEFTVQLGRAEPFQLDFPQVVDIVVPYQEQDLVLKLLAGDGVAVLEHKDDPEEIKSRYLPDGTYFLLVERFGTDAAVADQTASLDEVAKLVAGILSAGVANLGLSSRAETSDSSGGDAPVVGGTTVPEAEATLGVRVVLTPNLRRVTQEELETALDLRGELRTQRRAEAAGGANVEYAVIMTDSPLSPQSTPTAAPVPAAETGVTGQSSGEFQALVCAGTVVASEPVAQGRPPWRLVFGWTSGVDRTAALQLERERVVSLPVRPTGDLLERVRAFNKVFASCGGPPTDTVLAGALRAGATDAVTTLERPRWCQGTERATRGYFYLVTSSTLLLEAGAVVRAIGPTGNDVAGVELIDGYGYPASASEPPHYPLPYEALHCLGSGWDERWLTPARALQELNHREGATWEHVELAKGRAPSRAVPDSARFRSGPLEARVEQAAKWIAEFGVSTDWPAKPAVFDHHFLVATRKGIHDCCIDVGAIVRGQDWDGTMSPRFQVVYGWTAGSDSYYIDLGSLAYLGRELDDGWLDYTNELRRPSPDAGKYPLLVDRR